MQYMKYMFHVLHVLVLCVETVLLYTALCHHHGLPRVQVTHVSTAKHVCTPSEGDAYLIATRDGMFVSHYHILYIYVHLSLHITTYTIIVEAYNYGKKIKVIF